jgi:hypothetical protein
VSVFNKVSKVMYGYMEKCVIAICKLGCVRDQCGRKLQLPYSILWKLLSVNKTCEAVFGSHEKSMYGLNIKSKIMVHLSTP